MLIQEECSPSPSTVQRKNIPGVTFRPAISFAAGGGTGGVEIDDLVVKVLNSYDNEKGFITLFKEDFDKFEEGKLPENKGWIMTETPIQNKEQSSNPEVISITNDYIGSTKYLKIKGIDGNAVMAVKHFDISVDFPFDVSDKLFEIKYNERMDNDVSASETVENGHGPYTTSTNSLGTIHSSELINTYYIYSYDGKLMEEYDHNGNCVKQYIYFGNKLLAEYQPQTNKYYYYMTDQINSTRFVTDDNGNEVYSEAYGPYGDVQKTWTNTYDPKQKFSGKERESYSDLDYFGARYYDHNAYRFISVDPIINKDEALSNPQLWNLYSYTRNNPISYFDPDGRRETIGDSYRRAKEQILAQYGPQAAAEFDAGYMTGMKHGIIMNSLAAGAGLTGYFAPEIIAALAPVLKKAVQQAYRLVRILKGKYKKALDYALDQNKINHYFQDHHELESLVEKFGGRQNVVKKVIDSLGRIKTDSRGVFDVVRKIGGMDVRITGNVKDGLIKIGNIMKN